MFTVRISDDKAYTVDFQHTEGNFSMAPDSLVDEVLEANLEVHPVPVLGRRRFTICRIRQETHFDREGDLVALDISVLHPGEIRNREQGERVSFSRAIANLTASKTLRAEFWEAFRKDLEEHPRPKRVQNGRRSGSYDPFEIGP